MGGDIDERGGDADERGGDIDERLLGAVVSHVRVQRAWTAELDSAEHADVHEGCVHATQNV